MLNALKALLAKKKTIVAIIGIVMSVISKYTWAQHISEENLYTTIAGFLGLLGIGIAAEDVGKAKAQIESDANKTN